jgi:hypothetical protein
VLLDCKKSDITCRLQKIIPDGFPEIIFHFADPYRIKLDERWESQEESLIAGQITKHFFLENSGASDILGIKLKPTALTQIFGINMSSLKDKVVALPQIDNKKLNSINQLTRSNETHPARISSLNKTISSKNNKNLVSIISIPIPCYSSMLIIIATLFFEFR